MTAPAGKPAADELNDAVDSAIAACDGDARAAVRVLLVTIDHQQREINDLTAEIAGLAVHVSRGYSRGRRDRYLSRTRLASPSNQ